MSAIVAPSEILVFIYLLLFFTYSYPGRRRHFRLEPKVALRNIGTRWEFAVGKRQKEKGSPENVFLTDSYDRICIMPSLQRTR